MSDSQIDQQINVLSAAFSGAGFSFHRASIDRTDNASWFRGCAGGKEMPMKNALAIDPATTLNIYTCDPHDGILGYSYLPQENGESSTTHGVVLLYSTLPGGSAAPYDQGDTGTHEVGHYLGLVHTFDGGCEPGDEVDDTEPEDSPAYGCPSGRDSCPGGGEDPIENFMDYTDDACMDRFTSQQGALMRDMVGAYKPSLGSPLGPATPGKPTLVSPSGTTGTDAPTYQWDPVSIADSYRLKVIHDGTTVQDSTDNTGDVCSGSSCSADSSSTLADGDYSWQVLATNSDGDGPMTPAVKFTVSTDVILELPPAPFAIAPWGDVGTSAPAYLWGEVPGALEYEVRIQTQGRVVHQARYAASICGAALCELTSPPAPSLSPGYHRWSVRARNKSGDGPWSHTQAFRVRITLGRTTLIGPQGRVSTFQPVYRWHAVAGATQYQIVVRGPGGTIRQRVAADSICASGTCSIGSPTLPTLQQGRYRWWVRARAGASKGPRSTRKVVPPRPIASDSVVSRDQAPA